MSEQLQHFLVVYDIAGHHADVEPFGRDLDGALTAYAATEATFLGDTNVEVVLLGSDSRETLERTHSSYFDLADRHIDRIVARELLDFGLR
ncbi:MAG: hypothetical protein ACR2NB_02100 [Solirubrobacteraceae bacterium]